MREEFRKNYATYVIQKGKKVSHSPKKVRLELVDLLILLLLITLLF